MIEFSKQFISKSYKQSLKQIKRPIIHPIKQIKVPNLHILDLCNCSLVDSEFQTIISSLEAPLTMILCQNNNLIKPHFTDNQSTKELKVLNLANNQIKKLKSEFILNFTSLNALILNNNCIKQFPPLNTLNQLNTLVLSHNQLKQINLELPSLTKLSITHNQLTSIPGLECPKLCELRLAYNHIQQLPNLEVIQTYSSRLLLLDLGNNLLEQDCLDLLSHFTRLMNLNLAGNPFRNSIIKIDAKEDNKRSHLNEAYKLKAFKIFPNIRILDGIKISDGRDKQQINKQIQKDQKINSELEYQPKIENIKRNQFNEQDLKQQKIKINDDKELREKKKRKKKDEKEKSFSLTQLKNESNFDDKFINTDETETVEIQQKPIKRKRNEFQLEPEVRTQNDNEDKFEKGIKRRRLNNQKEEELEKEEFSLENLVKQSEKLASDNFVSENGNLKEQIEKKKNVLQFLQGDGMTKFEKVMSW